ncbi:unnamed protein product [Citrullus colocynthis]|uniref:Cytochrome c oxidase assembly factor 3 mitochondrial coiled-coil domain-containing protein n=1 Tax=Citrullus colocynthis TaxID=252529 RepID=A0ABP0YZD1_9ROSI
MAQGHIWAMKGPYLTRPNSFKQQFQNLADRFKVVQICTSGLSANNRAKLVEALGAKMSIFVMHGVDLNFDYVFMVCLTGHGVELTFSAGDSCFPMICNHSVSESSPATLKISTTAPQLVSLTAVPQFAQPSLPRLAAAVAALKARKQQGLGAKTKNIVVAGGLTAFVFGVYFYTMRAVGGSDELQVAIDQFEAQKSNKD